MENVAKGSDGRRLFTAEFKRAQIDRLLKGEITASELSRELGVALADPTLEVPGDLGCGGGGRLEW
jgi:hypothetical protein